MLLGASQPAAAPEGESAPTAGTPAYLQQAYDLSALAATGGSGDKVAIVDAYWDAKLNRICGHTVRSSGWRRAKARAAASAR